MIIDYERELLSLVTFCRSNFGLPFFIALVQRLAPHHSILPNAMRRQKSKFSTGSMRHVTIQDNMCTLMIIPSNHVKVGGAQRVSISSYSLLSTGHPRDCRRDQCWGSSKPRRYTSYSLPKLEVQSSQYHDSISNTA